MNEKFLVRLFWIAIIGIFIYFIVKEPDRDGYAKGCVEGYQIDKKKDVCVYYSPRFKFKDGKVWDAVGKCEQHLRKKRLSLARKYNTSGTNIVVDPDMPDSCYHSFDD